MPERKNSLALNLSFSLFIFAFLSLLTLAHQEHSGLRISSFIYFAFVAFLAFKIFLTGKISPYRSIFFISSAVGFIFLFKLKLWQTAQTLFFAKNAAAAQEVPNCYIAISTTILNFASSQFYALKSGHWSEWGFYSLGFLWLLGALVLGQAWCSWACFYGGIDETFSKIPKNPILPVKNIPDKLRFFPLGFLLFLILVSLAMARPIFCLWFCPLKMTTSFLDIDSTIRIIQTVIFITLGLLFLIIFPILTKKRTFCGLICPFGAWQSVVGQVNPYRVTIDKDKCIQCKKCLEICPVFAISSQSLEKKTVLPNCNRCGACLDICPTKAINYTILHKPVPVSNLFILGAFLLSAAFVSSFMPQALYEIFNLVRKMLGF